MAACAYAQAASPFPEVALPHPEPPSHRWAYVTLGTGALLVGGSFLLASRADDTYRSYLGATQLDQIERLYDRTVLYDRLATGTLVCGEALLATGIYLHFLRKPRTPAVTLILEPGRCALAYRF